MSGCRNYTYEYTNCQEQDKGLATMKRETKQLNQWYPNETKLETFGSYILLIFQVQASSTAAWSLFAPFSLVAKATGVYLYESTLIQSMGMIHE